MAEILSNVLCRRISYVNVTEEDARNAMKKMGMEDWFIDALVELDSVIRSGYASQSTTVVEQITGRSLFHLNNLLEIMLVSLIECRFIGKIKRIQNKKIKGSPAAE